MNYLPVSSRRIPHNGTIEFTAVISGYLLSRVYYGHSKREAAKLFRAYARAMVQS